MESAPGEFPVILTFYHLVSVLSGEKKQTKTTGTFTEELLGRRVEGCWALGQEGQRQKGSDLPSPFRFNPTVILSYFFHCKEASCSMLNTFFFFFFNISLVWNMLKHSL